MKKKTLLISLMLFVFVDFAIPGIQVTKPLANETIYKGGDYIIKWNPAGKIQDKIKITLWNADKSLNMILTNSASNKGQYLWQKHIINSKNPGKYFIRVKIVGEPILGNSGEFYLKEKNDLDIGIVEFVSLKPQPHAHRAPPILQPSNASFSIEKIYYDVNSQGKLTNVKVMITYKSKTAFSFNNYKGHPQDGPVYMNCIIWNPKWPDGHPIYAEKGPPTGELLFNHRLSVKYSGKNHMECSPEIHNIGSGMFQLIFTPSHSNRMQGLDTYQKMGGGGPFSPSPQCNNSYPPKMAVRVFIHTKEGVKNMYKEFYLEKTHRKTIRLPGETKSCTGGMVSW